MVHISILKVYHPSDGFCSFFVRMNTSLVGSLQFACLALNQRKFTLHLNYVQFRVTGCFIMFVNGEFEVIY